MIKFFKTNFDVNFHIISQEELREFIIRKGYKVTKSSKNIFVKNQVTITADPFILKKKDVFFLFYEELCNYYGNGILRVISSSDLKNWSTPKTVLNEPFHLSYPFVFEDSGKFYLIPETTNDRSIRLYEATSDNLDRWKLKTKLIDDALYCDSCVIKKSGKYYLFTTKDAHIYDGEKYELHLYVADRVEGPYTAHPMSPVGIGNKYYRNGGAVMDIDGTLFRPAQDCDDRYGDQLNIMKIDELTPTSYKESIYKNAVLPSSGHHMSMCKIEDGKYVVCTDSKELNFNIYQFYERFSHRYIRKNAE